ncbi:MAG: tetratricopeptide repeat protein [Ekhidna sp.]
MNSERAIEDLKEAVKLDDENYLAWYNLVILDEGTIVPDYLLDSDQFTPMLNLLGANACEQGEYALSIEYHSKAIEANEDNELGYLSRGKSLLRIRLYDSARKDFLKTMKLNPNRIETFYLIGNSFFHERKFHKAIGFYEQYLSIDRGYKNVWYNAAMAYLQVGNSERACVCLNNAKNLGMDKAEDQIAKQCDNQ